LHVLLKTNLRLGSTTPEVRSYEDLDVEGDAAIPLGIICM